MSDSTTSLIILAVIIFFFVTEKIPLPLTAILGMLAMSFSGILTWPQAFSGFASTSVLMIIGVCVVGAAFFTTGLSSKVGGFLSRVSGNDGKKFSFAVSALSSVMGIFFNATTVTALMMPIIDSVSQQSEGKVIRRYSYMPMAVGSIYGATLTAFSATSNVTASGLLAASELGRGLKPFEPFLIILPGVVFLLLFMLFGGYNYVQKVFKFEENPITAPTGKKETVEYNPVKARIYIIVVIAMMVAMTFTSINLAALFFLAGAVLILTNCIDFKSAVNSVSWPVFLLIGGAIGFAKGLEVSGAGLTIAEFVINVAGPLANSQFAMCVIMLVVCTFISNFMSNNAAVVIVMPIALGIAQSMGASYIPFALATAVGSNLSISTPVATPSTSLIYSLGYRFMDYIKFGGLINVIGTVGAAFALKVLYFM